MTSTSTRDRQPISVDVTITWEIASPNQLVDDGDAARLLSHALRQEGRTGLWEIAVRFVDDAHMIQMHELYLADASPTDILTFPYDDDDDSGGDILISVETAARNAADAGWSTAEELRFLLLHGVLHITGWDDDTHEKRAVMLERQHHLLKMWIASPSD